MHTIENMQMKKKIHSVKKRLKTVYIHKLKFTNTG